VTSPILVGKNARRFTAPSVIPGFGLTFGYTLIYLGLIVLFPLATLIWQSSGLGFSGLYAIAAEPRVAASLRTTFFISFAAAVVDLFFGLIVAWVLTRYDFPGRRLLDAFVDLPFALPTAVAGISLAALYSPNGWFGAPLADQLVEQEADGGYRLLFDPELRQVAQPLHEAQPPPHPFEALRVVPLDDAQRALRPRLVLARASAHLTQCGRQGAEEGPGAGRRSLFHSLERVGTVVEIC